jgi:hypothetical protein
MYRDNRKTAQDACLVRDNRSGRLTLICRKDNLQLLYRQAESQRVESHSTGRSEKISLAFEEECGLRAKSV